MFSRIGVIGAGAMGRGIALLFAQAGEQIQLYDTRAEAIEQALAFNRDLLQRSLAKGRITAEQLDATMARMQPAHTLAEMAGCDLLIEAIVEILDVKQKLFVELEALVGPEAILATNTTSLSVTAIARACDGRPDRHRALVAALGELYLERARAHGCRLDDAGVLRVLGMDIELNAQGLACWLDRAKP